MKHTNFPMITAKDNVLVEVTHSDCGFPPGGSEGRQWLNTQCVWIRPQGGDWIRTDQRSAMVVCGKIKHLTSAELADNLGVKDVIALPETSSN